MESTQQKTLRRFASLVGAKIQFQAQAEGIELESIAVCYNRPESAEFTCMVFPLICDKNSERAAMEGLKSALAAFIEKYGKERLGTDKRGIFYTEKPEEFFGALSEEKVGTGIYFPIAVIRRMTGGRFVLSPMPYAYVGIGVVGGTQEQNKSLILKILPDLLTEMKKYDKALSLPRALFYNTKA